jgi:phage protein D
MPVYDSRPRVLIRGTFDVSSRLSEFRVDERANRPMRCALTFTTSPDSLLNGGSVLFGDEVEVLIGAPEVRLFKGIVLSVGIARKDGGDRQAEIVACDRLVQMEYSRKTRGFEDSDVDSILTNLASEHSFSAEISVASPSMKQQVQANETDLEFAARMAEAVGAEIWIDDREFYAAAWHDRPGTTIQIDAGTAFDDFSVAADLRGQPEAVDVRGWDALHGETVSSVAGQSQSGRPAADILQQIGLAAGPASVVHTGAEDGSEAAARAAARFSSAARRFAGLKADMSGNPTIRIGAALLVNGVPEAFVGRYRVDGTVHAYSPAEGYRTSIEASRPVYEGR